MITQKPNQIVSLTLRLVCSTALILVATAMLSAGARQADLSRPVFLGDSLMAGFQNGSLKGSQQVHGIAALIAQQAGVDLPLPLIADPGIPNALILLDPGPPPVIGQEPGVSTGRIDPLLQTWNLAVPGHTVEDALTLRPSLPIDSREDLILGLPGLLFGVARSQLEWTEALDPSLIVVWLGPNDALGAALEADANMVTPITEFEAAYTDLMERLEAIGVPVVVANIPDVTVIPYLTSAEKLAALIGAPLSLIGPALGVAAGDYVTPGAFAL